MRYRLASVLVVAFMAWSCGGSSSGTSNMNAPSPINTTTINIVASNGLSNLGGNSFVPNPASASQGAMLVWHNGDSTTHHSAHYHCTIHPTMVGSINMATSSTPSMGSGYLR